MTVVPGSITDRPWGATLHALAQRRFSGELAIDSDGKRFALFFDDGAIAGARSPLAADAIARIALTSHAINQSHVAEIARQIAQAPQRDEIELVAEIGKLSLDAAAKLRHRALAQRAARTFALERGQMQTQDATAPSGAWLDGRDLRLAVRAAEWPRGSIDIRHVIFLGARTHLSDARLLDVVRQAGASLALARDARDGLARFGFDDAAQPVLDALARGTSLPELEAAHRELDPRLIHAIIYALVACEAFAVPTRITANRVARPTPAPRTSDSALIPPEARRPASDVPMRSMTPIVHVDLPRAPAPPPEPLRAARPEARLTARNVGAPYASTAPDAGTNTPAATRRTDQGRPAAGSTPPLAASAARAQVAATPPAGLPVVRIHGTATPPLGVPALPTPTLPPAVAAAGTKAQPPITTEPATSRVDTDEVRFPDQRTPAPAFPDQRTPGFTDQRTPGFTEQRTPTSGPVMSRVSTDTAVAAEAACKRGEAAMKRDQPGDAILEFKAAVDLDPGNVDYGAMLAWAKFCAAGDKAAIGNDTRKMLERAVFKSHRPERARFYLGRVERMLGRDKEALRHFNEVLELKPNHAEAASEVRAIEARLAAARGGSGLFGRKK